jgi:outer membrane translocation and assembly module TamA
MPAISSRSPDGDKVPILDRFFKGGDSLRGFMRSGIGPRMRNEFNGEYRLEQQPFRMNG